MSSGHFSSYSSPLIGVTHAGKAAADYVVWNGRGILAQDLALRKRKVQELQNIIVKHDAAAFLEMHGSPEEFWSAFGYLAVQYEIFFSPGFPSYDAGGVAWFIKKASFHPSACIVSSTLAPGRVVQITIDIHHREDNVSQTLELVAVHNHALRDYIPILQQKNL